MSLRNIASGVVAGTLALSGGGCSIVHRRPNIPYEGCSVRTENSYCRVGAEPIDTETEMALYMGYSLEKIYREGILINYLGFENTGQHDVKVFLGGSGLTNGPYSWHRIPHGELKLRIRGREPSGREKALMIASTIAMPWMVGYWAGEADSQMIFKNLEGELLPNEFVVMPGEVRRGWAAFVNREDRQYNPLLETEIVIPVEIEKAGGGIITLEMSSGSATPRR